MEAIIEPSVVEVEVPVTHPARTMPLQIGLTGEPAEGFAVADFEQTPLEVSVFGEERVLNRLEFYAGGSVDVTGLREDATFNVTLPKTDGVSQLEPETAQVKVRIVPSVRKSFSGVRLNLAGVRANLEAAIRDPRDGVVTVTLEGAEQTLNGLEANDIDLIVDVSNLTPGVHQVEVSYSLPAFVRVVSDGSPLAVTVEIREADAEESGTSPEGPRDEEPGSGDAGTGGSGSGSTSGRDDGDDDNDPADNDGLSEVSENGGSPDGINMQVLMHRFFGTGA
jgi:YbbR domain-containing protein